jgi:hypothetical protein
MIAHLHCLFPICDTHMNVAGADRLLVIQSTVDSQASLITRMVANRWGNHVAQDRGPGCNDAPIQRRGSVYHDGTHTANRLAQFFQVSARRSSSFHLKPGNLGADSLAEIHSSSPHNFRAIRDDRTRHWIDNQVLFLYSKREIS